MSLLTLNPLIIFFCGSYIHFQTNSLKILSCNAFQRSHQILLNLLRLLISIRQDLVRSNIASMEQVLVILDTRHTMIEKEIRPSLLFS